MWWAIFFAAVTATLLVLVGVFVVLADAYKEALEAYRLAKFALDEWTSLVESLNASVCQGAEELAKRALADLNISHYRELGPLLGKALEETRQKTLLRKLNYSWAFEGDVFIWNVTVKWHNVRRAGGAVNWLRPSELINAAESIKGTSFDLTYYTVEEALAPHVPKGAVLYGVVYGRLYGNRSYSGFLIGEYRLWDKTPLRCTGGRLEAAFSADHYATLVINSTAPYIDIYEEVYVER
ncbi:hypothetical protein [Pyrobaculum sp.]|uniref:hypothetical protein n=1 Tax=Pyrobaculum sp. TaxID=2004705 RepID=UPI00315FD8FB